MKVLILAGGYGTRLYPLIKDIPKALLDVSGKTLVEHTLDKCAAIQSVDEVLVVTNAKFYDLMSKWAEGRNGKPFPIRVINDGTRTPEERLGAIGDILFVLDRCQVSEDLLVLGSDNLYDQGLTDFIQFAQGKGSAVTVGAYDVESLEAAKKYGVIELDQAGRMLSLEEKPAQPRSSLISMCLYYYPRESFPMLRSFITETNHTDTTGGYIQWLYKKTAVYGFKFSGKWYDIGSLESYYDAQKHFAT
ncbi:MAG: nucleotidyltransferase family protein [Candidatus Omnitrophica bacterium]|nr:nucleotidyltransferase family protein [Candidatus Omnitrophota bacterium]